MLQQQNDAHQRDGDTCTSIRRMVLELLVIVSIVTLGWLLQRSHSGFDTTDESYYALWIENPGAYGHSVTQFGFIYHPLYVLLQHNIVWLRELTALLFFVLTGWLSHTVLARDLPPGTMTRGVHNRMAIALAALGLVYFFIRLPTPSYNSLAVQSVLLATLCALKVRRVTHARDALGWAMMGLAGWLTFMAKPTTAGVFGVVMLLFLISEKRADRRGLTIAALVGGGGLLIGALTINGSVIDYGRGLVDAAQHLSQLVGPNAISIFRVDGFVGTLRVEGVAFAIATIIVCIAASCILAGRVYIQQLGYAITGALGAGALAIATEYVPIHYPYTQQVPLLLITAPLGAGIAIALRAQRWVWPKASAVRLALLLLALPYVYAFGTGNNYLSQACYASALWMLAGIAFVRGYTDTRWQVWLPYIAMAQLILVAALSTGMESPYRQPQPLRLNASPLTVGNSSVRVDAKLANYISALSQASAEHGFTRGTLLIDLTGHYPGTAYLLGATPLGTPWLMGGYPGSEDFLRSILQQASCEQLAHSWVLTEPEGPLAIAPTALSAQGLHFPDDYRIVATVASPSYDMAKQLNHVLYQPATTSVAACRLARTGNASPSTNPGQP